MGAHATETRAASPRVLLVENRAHLTLGHFPVQFAELGTELTAMGVRVEVLTARGWAYEADRGPPPFDLDRYGRLGRLVDGLGERLTASRSERVQSVGSVVRNLALLGATRARVFRARRRHEQPPSVLSLSVVVDPLLTSVLAGPSRWVVYVFSRPGRGGNRLDRLVHRVARAAERRRRRRGGALRVATPNESVRAAWDAAASFLEPAVAPIAGCRTRAPIADARARLGIPADERVALLFGFPHDDKDTAVVWEAFGRLPEWRLLVAGQMAGAYKRMADDSARAARVLVVPGHLEPEECDVVHAAADLAVLSFQPGFDRESGTLVDAISFGLVVVCSGHCAPAEIVREHRLGVVYEPGDPQSLADAVRAAPARIANRDLDRARSELSCRAAASRHLELLVGAPRG